MFSLTSASRLLTREGIEGERGRQVAGDRSLGQNPVIQHIFLIPKRDQLFFSVKFEQEGFFFNSVELNFWPDYYIIPMCKIKIDSSKAEKYICEE